jgi:hypothetical protein
LREDGFWEFIPPASIDLDRKPMRHHRFKALRR